jgi:hypothetical protein
MLLLWDGGPDWVLLGRAYSGGGARLARNSGVRLSCALYQAGWFSQELNYSQFQLPFLLYCNIFSYIVPPDHSVIFRKPDLPIRLILRQKLKSNGYFNMHSTFKIPIWSVEELL